MPDHAAPKISSDDETSTLQMLVGAGHSVAKAMEILLDRRRGDRFAIDWVAMIQKSSDAVAFSQELTS